jgi:hypothetical protein
MKAGPYNDILNMPAMAWAKNAIPQLVHESPTDFEPVEPAPADDPAVADIAKQGFFLSENAPRAAPNMALLGLKRGGWIASRNDDGEEVRAQLSWISPLNGSYLFTNRKGEDAVTISPDALAAKVEAGEVRIISSIPLMDRVVGSLMERLKGNAADGVIR